MRRTGQLQQSAESGTDSADPVRIGLFGCPPGTGNRGVDALRLSTLKGLADALPHQVEATVFDYGRGLRTGGSELADTPIRVRQMGAYYSRRITGRENLQQMLWALRIGAGSFHPGVRELKRLSAVLDVSGGDSFADIYGARRFRGSSLTKQVTLAAGVPLMLLPQTYGPYMSTSSRGRAASILRKTTRAWARDPESLRVVEALLGYDFEAIRHKGSVDVAFLLETLEPPVEFKEALLAFKEQADTLVALNVSGLLFNVEGYDRERFGFREGYRTLIESLVRWLLDTEGIRVVLVPHVESQYKHDCDVTASRALFDGLTTRERQRVLPTPPGLGARELKWVIGQSDWACATRMHAAIAAISQGIPTAAVAYSDKTKGVFETAGISNAVIDPRDMGNAEALECIRHVFDNRTVHANALSAQLPNIQLELRELFASIVQLAGTDSH